MAYIEGLTPLNERSLEERTEIARKGGIASGIARQKKKLLKDELIALLSDGDTQKKVSVALIKQALDGNVKAFETLRDTVGEKPIDKQEITGTINNGKLDDLTKELFGDDDE